MGKRRGTPTPRKTQTALDSLHLFPTRDALRQLPHAYGVRLVAESHAALLVNLNRVPHL